LVSLPRHVKARTTDYKPPTTDYREDIQFGASLPPERFQSLDMPRDIQSSTEDYPRRATLPT